MKVRKDPFCLSFSRETQHITFSDIFFFLLRLCFLSLSISASLSLSFSPILRIFAFFTTFQHLTFYANTT